MIHQRKYSNPIQDTYIFTKLGLIFGNENKNLQTSNTEENCSLICECFTEMAEVASSKTREKIPEILKLDRGVR